MMAVLLRLSVVTITLLHLLQLAVAAVPPSPAYLQLREGARARARCNDAGQPVFLPGALLNVTLDLEVIQAERIRQRAVLLPEGAGAGDCKLEGALSLLTDQGSHLETWHHAASCGWSASGESWVQIQLPQVDCSQCSLELAMQGSTTASGPSAASACISVQAAGMQVQVSPAVQDPVEPMAARSSSTSASSAGQSWVYRVAGHLATVVPAAARRLLQTETSTDCSSSGGLVSGFRQCVEVVGVDSNGPPPRKQWIYWSMDLNPSNSDVGPGVFFAIELAPSSRDEAGNLLPPGWVGLGWSQIGPEHHPPQMINGTAVMGYVDENGEPRLNTYDLGSKNLVDITLSRDSYSITNATIELTPELHLVLRFRRRFDANFEPGKLQRLISAHHHEFRGFVRHNHRVGLNFDPSGEGRIFVVATRLSIRKVQAHAWTMIVAWGILLPFGIIWARYFRDLMGKWYLVHIGIQALGLVVALASFLIAVTQFNPIPRSLGHFELGLTVMIIALLQPLNSLPRLTMHHSHVMRSIYWAYVHWLFGRAAVAFAWVNIFLGIGRYRTWFGLGSWADAAFGFYIAGIALICLILESRKWMTYDLRLREENDELSRRIAHFELGGGDDADADDSKVHRKPQPRPGPSLHADDDDELLDQMPVEVPTRSGSPLLHSNQSDARDNAGIFTDSTTQQDGADHDDLRDFDSNESGAYAPRR